MADCCGRTRRSHGLDAAPNRRSHAGLLRMGSTPDDIDRTRWHRGYRHRHTPRSSGRRRRRAERCRAPVVACCLVAQRVSECLSQRHASAGGTSARCWGPNLWFADVRRWHSRTRGVAEIAHRCRRDVAAGRAQLAGRVKAYRSIRTLGDVAGRVPGQRRHDLRRPVRGPRIFWICSLCVARHRSKGRRRRLPTVLSRCRGHFHIGAKRGAVGSRRRLQPGARRGRAGEIPRRSL